MGRTLSRLLRLMIIFLAVALIGLSLFRYKYNNAIRSLAETQVTNTTSDLINDAIDQQIQNGNIQYDRMVYFEKDLDGKITALKTNMHNIRSDITSMK